MYKMGDLIKKGYGFRFKAEDFYLLSHIRNYIFNMGFEPDYGMWEEGPEEHASSFGAVLGGLTMWFDQGFYDYKYRHKNRHQPLCAGERTDDRGRQKIAGARAAARVRKPPV